LLALSSCTEKPMSEPKMCERCDGCGKLADTEERGPWTAWTSLPLRSAVAVIAGLVKPITCDVCGGTGKKP